MTAEKGRGPGSASAEIEKYLAILAKDPGSRVFAPLAEAFRKAGQFDDAIETALEGLRHHPNYLGGRVALGRAYFDKRQYAEAESEMRQVAMAAPDNLMAHKVLGQIAFKQGDLAAAEKAARMVLLLDPRDEEAQQLLERAGGGARPEPPAAPPPPVPVEPPAVPESFAIEEIPLGPQAPVEAEAALPVAEPAGEAIPPTVESWAPAAAPQREPSELPPELPAESALALESESPPELELEPEPPERLELQPLAGPETSSAALQPEAGTETTESEPPSGPEPVATAPLAEEESGALELEPLSSGEPPGAMAQVTEDEPDALELEPLSGPVMPSVAVASETAAESAALELEVFSREPLEEQGRGAAEPGPEARAAVEEPAIEVFGRPKREGPPRTTKGERRAFEEIELEPTAFAATEPEAESDEESPFEIFTRDPRGAEAPTGPRRPNRGESSGYREIELEPVAPMASAAVEAEDAGTVAAGLEEEPPRVGAMREIDLAPQEMEIPPVPEGATAPAATSYFPVEELLSGEFEREAPLIEPPPVATEPAPPAPEPPQPGSEVHDGTEAPDFLEEAAVVETSAQVLEVPREEMAEEATEEAEEAAGPAPRGVFDTETLAAIYVSQGFHARAAEIYRRLVEQYPGDEKLRRKLDEVLARERGEQRAAQPRAGADDEKIRRLQVLLDAFRGGRQ